MFISKFCRNFAHVFELNRHIEILLLNNDCVIVPGLGGFMTHHVEARYDERDSMFLPPLRTLGFNPQLNLNDSLLAQSYIEAYDISYPEALKRIEDEVNELRQHLQNEGSYELDDIGTLALNDDGNYIFTPCEAGILTPAFYGLSSFEMKPIALQEATPETVEPRKPKAHKEIATKPVAQIITLGAETPKDEEEEGRGDDMVHIKYSWIRNAVAAAAILLAVFILSLPSGKTDIMTRSISNLNNGLLFGMTSKDTNTSKIEIQKKLESGKWNDSTLAAKAKADSVLTASADSVSQSITDSVSNSNLLPPSDFNLPQKAYCIVLASYVSMRNANAFVNQLKKEGYEQSEIFVRNNVTRVIYGHYASEQDAYNDLRRFHRYSKTAEAWVMEI